MYSNPFTIDQDYDRIDLAAAISAADLTQPYEENEMAEPVTARKITKKVTAAAPTAAAKPTKITKSEPKAKTGKPRTLPEGCIGITELAAELGVGAAAVRRKLRNLEGIERAEGGMWQWKEGSKELTAVRKAFATA